LSHACAGAAVSKYGVVRKIVLGGIDGLAARQACVDNMRRSPDSSIGHKNEPAVVGNQEKPDILLRCAVGTHEQKIGSDQRRYITLHAFPVEMPPETGKTRRPPAGVCPISGA
jgi:hypothetical protein